MNKFRKISELLLTTFLVACGGGGGTTTAVSSSSQTPPAVTTFTISGSVTGLPSGTSLSLQDNDSDTITLSSNTSFTFPTALTSGQTYSVTVSTAPSGYTCIGQNASGTTTANVTNISFACSSGTYSSVSTNVEKNSYPTTYTTVDKNPNSNICHIDISKVSYPSSWNGVQTLPTVTGAPLAAGISTLVNIKDILPSDSLPSNCINPSNITEFTRTVARLKVLGTNVVQISQWHWAKINSDGTYSFTGDTYGSLSDSELSQYILIAHAAGIKVLMSNQIQGFVDYTGTNNINNPTGNSLTWGRWLTAFQTHMLNRATVFQSLGVDYWEMGCNSCVYGDTGDNSDAAIQQFSTAYQNIVAAISLTYKGKRYVSAQTWMATNPTYLANIDMLQVGLWDNQTYTSASENSITVQQLKSLYLASGAVFNLNAYNSLGKPLLLVAGIQSRSNALSLPGYMEETTCTNAVNSMTFNTSCIQNQTAASFSLQAVVIEAQFETYTSVSLVPGSIVGVSDYWQTDFMSSNGPTFPNIGSSIRNKPAEGIVKQWFAGH